MRRSTPAQHFPHRILCILKPPMAGFRGSIFLQGSAGTRDVLQTIKNALSPFFPGIGFV